MIGRAESANYPVADDFRTGRAYSIAQAARLAKTTGATVRRWLVGYQAPGHRMTPVFGDRRSREGDGQLLVSFLDLIQIAVVARFRAGSTGRRKVSLHRLRRAHEYARRELGLPYPFATLKLFEYGGHVLHRFEEQEPGPGVLALDVGGQWVLPHLVQEERHHLDFQDGDPFAVRWYPMGRDVPIVVDPHIAGGRPTIYRRGVTLDTIIRRWKAGEPMAGIADDYEIEVPVVEAALRNAA